MRGIVIAVGVLLPALLAGLPTVQAASAAPARPAATGSSVAVLDVVMLVDESGSETAAKVAAEKTAVSTIAQSMLNPLSRVTVIGFGGVNHVAPNQNPVDIVCPPTIANPAGLSDLASCVNGTNGSPGLHRRSEAEGDDTDYAAALTEAMNYLFPTSTATPPSPAHAIKVILMMTDGAVDVHRDTQQYGGNWQLGEQAAINQQLALASQDGVQLWPLGFGNNEGTGITQQQAESYLNNMAAHGARATCDPRQQPHANWVNDLNDAINALYQLYGASSCVEVQPGPPEPLPGGQSRTLTVNIPAIASDAAISVRRGSPNVSVTFIKPDGATWTDTTAISGADGNSTVETLHVNDITSNTDVGTWKVQLTAPAGLASQLVSATVFWQGAVRAVINAPPSVTPDKPITVTLSLLGPNGPITDAATLGSLLATVTATGDGLVSQAIPLVRATDSADAGTYTGTLTAPTQTGTLVISGNAQGYGFYATNIPVNVTVGASQTFTAVPSFPIVSHVQRGSTLSGQVAFTNTTGNPRQVRLELTASGADAKLTRPVGAITVPSGQPPMVPFTVSVGHDSPLGTAELIVQAVDAANGQPYDSARVEFAVTTPPGFIAQYLRYLITAAILLVLLIALLLWLRARRRARIDTQDLFATLRRGGEVKGRELPGGHTWSDVFRFIIADEDTQDPYLAYPPAGWPGSVYQVRRPRKRSLSWMVILTAPTRPKPYEVEVNGPGVALDNGLELSFRDKRRHSAPPGPAADHPGSPPVDPWGGGSQASDLWGSGADATVPTASSAPGDSATNGSEPTQATPGVPSASNDNPWWNS